MASVRIFDRLQFGQQREITRVPVSGYPARFDPRQHSTCGFAAVQTVPEAATLAQGFLEAREVSRQFPGGNLHRTKIAKSGGVDQFSAPGQGMQGGRTGDVPAEPARIVDRPNREVKVGQKGIQERTLPTPEVPTKTPRRPASSQVRNPSRPSPESAETRSTWTVPP